MAIVELQRREAQTIGYFHKETIADGLTGDDIHVLPIGRGGARVSCSVIAGAGTGKIQFSTSPDAEVLAETAVWQDWPNGDVTGTSSDTLLSAVTGLRGASITGEIDIEIVY
jgi:hypothetical protein